MNVYVYYDPSRLQARVGSTYSGCVYVIHASLIILQTSVVFGIV